MPMSVDYDPFADGAIERTLSATESQKEIWTASQLGVDASCAFNESVSVHIRGLLQTEMLVLALERLAHRHEALRTTFSPDGELLCILEKAKPLVFQEDLSDESDPEALFRAFCAQEVETPFNLEHGPLFRFSLLRMSEQHHVLVITAHHIIFDGWSSAVAIGELGSIYDQVCGLTAEPLPPAPRFSDYAAWLDSRADGKARDYWVSQFGSPLPAFELPIDRQRPRLRTFRSGRVDLLLDSGLATALKETAGQRRVSLLVLLLSAWIAFLHRITGATDLVTGLPAAGQNAAGMPGLIGHCVNLLPLRVSVDPGASFAALVDSLRATMLEAIEHQEFTFGSLLQALLIPRDPSRIPLVPVQFNLDPTGLVAQGFSGLQIEVTNNPRSFENFELFLNLTKVSNGIRIECQYNADLFDEAGVRQRLDEFAYLLRSITKDPTSAVATLDVVPEASRRKLLVDWNATDASFDLSHGAHVLVDASSALRPDAIAVVAGDQTVSYRELSSRADGMARMLKRRGVRRGDLIGIAFERDATMIVSVLACWKAGAGYVPLDPEFPRDRIRYMIEDAAISVVIATHATATTLALEGVEVIYADAPEWAAEPSTDLEDGAGPDDVAYLIYTSGSTGKPKGVRVLHRNVVNFLRAMVARPGFSVDDTLVAVTTLSFDIALLELFLPLTAGGRVVVAGQEQTRDGSALAALLDRSRATVMQATPATWRMLVESEWSPSNEFTALCGGEALPGELAERLLGCVSRLFNMYGPTETTVWSSFHEVNTPEPIIPIGRPIQNTRMFVLSTALQLAPVGVVGELYIGGDGVTAGYHQRDELTRERFILSPFESSSRLYRTGDLARWRRDGVLEYLGRIDAQVKVRGFRIELGELEAALAQCPGICAAVASTIEPTPGDARLVAYYVSETGDDLPAQVIRDHLATFLPSYMLPQHLVRLDTIPLTPNRKVDRKALPPVTSDRREVVAPRSEAELAVAAIWKQVLGVEVVGVEDDFFELGGHSILATRVIARIREELDIHIPLRRIFEGSRLEALAGHVAALLALRRSEDELPGGEREEISF